MRIGKHGIFDAGAARPLVCPGIEYWRGWNQASDPVWSRETEAVLRTCATLFAQPVALAMTIRTFNADGIPAKTLHIHSNGHDPVAVPVARRGVQTVLVQTPVMAPDAAYGFMTFSMDAPQSPAQLGLSDDERLLGVCIMDIRAVAMPVALPVDFCTLGGAGDLLAAGWDRIEEGAGVWSVSEAPRIILPGYLDFENIAALAFDIETLPRTADHAPLHIEVWGAARRLAVWDFGDSTGGIRHCPVAPSQAADGFEITFHIDGLASPEMLGINADQRMLGLLMRSIDRVAGPVGDPAKT